MTKYLVLEIETNTIGSELVSDIIQEQGSDVSIFDQNDFLNLIKSKEVGVIWDYYNKDLEKVFDTVICRGYFDIKEKTKVIQKIKESLEQLKKNSPFDLGTLKINYFEQEQIEWINVWKKFYKIITVKNFVIKPVWEKYEEKNNKTIIEINPGTAFGTGEHKTTQLVLSLINDIDLKNKNALDMGTGSGILGIALIKRGVSKCKMYDIDENAIKNCIQNIKINNVENNTFVDIKSSLVDEKDNFDIITANITADILINLKLDFIKHLNKNGYLVISGIIKERENEIKNIYNDESFKLIDEDSDDTWTALLYKKIK